MVGCSILGCKNHGERKYEGITFHRFPCKPIIIDKWIAATGRSNWIPDKFSHVCSIHFEKEAFQDQPVTRTLLKRQAIPTLFINNEFNVDQPLDNDNLLRPMKYTRVMPDYVPRKHAYKMPSTAAAMINRNKAVEEPWIENESKESPLGPSNDVMAYRPGTSTVEKQQYHLELPFADTPNAMAYIPGTIIARNQQYQREITYNIITPPNDVMTFRSGTTTVHNQQYQKDLPYIDTPPDDVMAPRPGTTTVQKQQIQIELPHVDDKSYQYQFQLTVMEYMKKRTYTELKAPNIESMSKINKRNMCAENAKRVLNNVEKEHVIKVHNNVEKEYVIKVPNNVEKEYVKKVPNNLEKEYIKKVPNVITKDYVLKVFNIENNGTQIFKTDNVLIDHTYSKNSNGCFESKKKRKRKSKRLTTPKGKSRKKPQELNINKGKKKKTKLRKKILSRKNPRELKIKKRETIKIAREPLHALNTRHNRRKTMLHDTQYSELNVQGDFKQEPLLQEHANEYELLNNDIMHKPHLHLHFETDDFKQEQSEECNQILNESQNLEATISNPTFYPSMNYEANDIKEETIDIQEHTNESILFNTLSGCNATMFDGLCSEDSLFVEDIKQESTELQETKIKTEAVLDQGFLPEEIMEAEEFKREPTHNGGYDICGVTSTVDQIYPVAIHRVSDIIQFL